MPFDLGELSSCIDRARRERGLIWAALSSEVGVSASTIRRFRTAPDAEADGVLALISWLGVPPEHFVSSAAGDGELLPAALDGMVRVDMPRVAEALGKRPGPSGTRTTIQRLVTAALASETSVASLTRWSPT